MLPMEIRLIELFGAMKKLIVGVILLIPCLLLVRFIADHALFGIRGALIASGSEHPPHTEGTRKQLISWLTKQGFVEVESPIGGDAWAGLRGPADTDTWFKGQYGDSPEFFVIIRQPPPGAVPTRARTIHTYVEYHIRTLKWRVDDELKQVESFVPVLADWFDELNKTKGTKS